MKIITQFLVKKKSTLKCLRGKTNFVFFSVYFFSQRPSSPVDEEKLPTGGS